MLYTPTFRKTDQENQDIMKHFPVERLKETLGKDWVIGIKMHPKYPADNIPEDEFCLNLTGYPQIIDLLLYSLPAPVIACRSSSSVFATIPGTFDSYSK